MNHEAAVLARFHREQRVDDVRQHGEEAVREMELACQRLPLERANYNNVRHLLARDEMDGAQPATEPRLPTWDEIKARLRARKKTP